MSASIDILQRLPDLQCASLPGCTGNGWTERDDHRWAPCNCPLGREQIIRRNARAAGLHPVDLEHKPIEIVSEEHGRLLQAIAGWCENFAPGTSGSLVLMGGVGRGKTLLAKRCLIAMIGRGFRGRLIAWASLLRTIRASYDRAGLTEDEILEEVLDQDVIVLDDIGAEPAAASDWGPSTLCSLLDSALTRRRPAIVITTNLSGKQIRSRYGARVAGRVQELASRERGGMIASLAKIPDFRASMAGEVRW